MRKVIVIGVVGALAACSDPATRWGWMFEETATRPAVEAPEGGGGGGAGGGAGGHAAGGGSVAASTTSSTTSSSSGYIDTHRRCDTVADCPEPLGGGCENLACLNGECMVTSFKPDGTPCAQAADPNGYACDNKTGFCRGPATCVVKLQTMTLILACDQIGNGYFPELQRIDYDLNGKDTFCTSSPETWGPCSPHTTCTMYYGDHQYQGECFDQ